MASGGLSIKVTRDTLTPDLQRKLRAVTNPAPIWRAVGTGLVSYTKRSFRDASLRQAAWPAKSAVADSGPTEGAKIHRNQHGTFSARASRQARFFRRRRRPQQPD